MAVINENGKILYPVVVQHERTLQILMVAFADEEAMALTRETGLAHFYSRSRQKLWKKGETSGNFIAVRDIVPDCDADSFIYVADTNRPACHLNQTSCFGDSPGRSDADPLASLAAIIQERVKAPHPESSYTLKLLQGPLDQLLKKIGEEAIEVIIAAQDLAAEGGAPKPTAIKNDMTWEAVDLLYHLAVLLHRLNISMADLSREVLRRHQSPANAGD